MDFRLDLRIIELTLQVFGLFWMVGGVVAFRQAQMSDLIDNALEALTQNKEDRLINQFLYLGSILTFFSGLGLLVRSRWVLISLGLLIASQLVYFKIKHQCMSIAKTEEERLEATVNNSTFNAFIVSIIVAIAALISLKLGLLK